MNDHDSRHLRVPVWGLFILAVMGVLYVGQSVFVPIFMATLIAFLLTPPVNLLAKYYVPRALGSAIVMVVSASIIGVLFTHLADPVSIWIERLPGEIQQIERKLSPFKDSIETVQETTQKVEEMASISDGTDQRATDAVISTPSIFSMLLNSTQSLLVSLFSFLVLLYFMLAFGPTLVLRTSLLFEDKSYQAHVLKIARDVQYKLSRYLLLITALNILLGVAVTLLMWLLGMPTPIVWGASAALLNYIPYVGPAINLIIISLVSLQTFDSLTQVFLPPALLIVLNLLEGQILQPLFIGRMFTINPVLIFIFVLIWGWMWGMAGIFLAVPMLVIMNIILEKNDLRAANQTQQLAQRQR